ncbi:acyl-CoA N-acyltransferase [Rhizoctonia solani]|nr:acyl-CoA N-acyltransferase [Rhizoctonia solani]
MMLRPATPDDLDVLRQIKDDAQKHLTRIGSQQALGDVGDINEYFIFASNLSGPIGMCRLCPRVPAHVEPCLPTRPDIYLSSLIVHPDFQSQGLGRQMVLELQSLGKSMALDVWAGNGRLKRWYEELGWRCVGTVEETDGDPPETYDVAVYIWP